MAIDIEDSRVASSIRMYLNVIPGLAGAMNSKLKSSILVAVIRTKHVGASPFDLWKIGACC